MPKYVCTECKKLMWVSFKPNKRPDTERDCIYCKAYKCMELKEAR